MLHFSIRDWRVVSTRLAGDDDWLAWAQQGVLPERAADYRPALPFLSPMQRRRLNPAARLMVDAAWPLLDAGERLPVVYVSHDGEINRSFELWLSLLRGEGVSPTSFGLSVHNALAGQWSMLRQDPSESTALCVRQAGLEVAVVEACGLLADGAEAVLVLVADDPLSNQYPVPVARAPFAYALALVVTAGKGWRLSCEQDMGRGGSAGPDYWRALDWVACMLRGGGSHVCTDGPRVWRWEQCS